jgi:hypothetical protein
MKKISVEKRKIKLNILKKDQNIQKRKHINQKNQKENKFCFFF